AVGEDGKPVQQSRGRMEIMQPREGGASEGRPSGRDAPGEGRRGARPEADAGEGAGQADAARVAADDATTDATDAAETKTESAEESTTSNE
ncbi:MAG: hypothetical protein ACF8LK_05180, partial [Phycisphaerales bacterium JB041]